MKRRALWKDIFREIWRTKARFLSILAIITLGVGFFAGIRAAGPDMLDTADHYYQEHGLMDLKVLTNYGLTADNIEELRQVADVSEVQPGYSADAFLGDSGLTAKVFSYQPEQKLNRYKAITGRLPKSKGEIALDDNAAVREHYQVGDTVTFTFPAGKEELSDNFRQLSYKVVGTVRSPMFIDNMSRPTSSIGKGKADAFAVIAAEDFSMSVYTEAYMTFKDTAGKAPYSTAYDESVERHVEIVKQAVKHQPEERMAEIKAEAQAKLDKGKAEIADGRKKLADGATKLKEAEAKLADGRKEYDKGVAQLKAELGKAQAKLDQAQAELAKGRREWEASRDKLEAGQSQLTAGQKQLTEQRRTALPQLTAGQELAASLGEALALPPEALPAEQREQLLAAASAADAGLGEALGGYYAGAVDLATAKGAVAAFADGLTEARAKLDAAQQELDARQAELDAGRKQLDAGKAKLDRGQAEYEAGVAQLAQARKTGEAKLAQAEADLKKGEAEYNKGLTEYESEKVKAERKLADAEQDIADGEKKLAELAEPKAYVMDRSSNTGYAEYSDNAERLDAIATAFPVFFFLIAALVSLTTMTRMVEEQRLQIGTLKALGYSNGQIMLKFLVYGTLASFIAALIGLAVGFTLFPTIIANAYGSLYNLPPVRLSLHVIDSVISIAVALLCTTMTAFIATRVELRGSASVLMRPKAPKSGQRILLERVRFLWKRLSFVQKVTFRNLFRYKQRMFMTVIGVAGCTALILTGFGLKDSISDIGGIQFGQVMKYQAVVAFHPDARSGERRDYDQIIADTPEITATLNTAQDTMLADKKGVNQQEVILFVPEQVAQLPEFVSLHDRGTRKVQPLTDDGAVVTEKLARLYNLKPGSTLAIKNNENDTFSVKISGIAENYTRHYLYMTPAYYESVMGKAAVYNSQLLNTNNQSATFEDDLSGRLSANGRVAMVSFASSIGDSFAETLSSMDIVMVVLIVSAAALAFVVLYNLTNINVSERVRELSTIKVLGFYDNEVTLYIYRENLILTFLGIIGGSFLGVALHRFVLTTAEMDAMMFSPAIKAFSYGYSGILTLLFAGIVMAAMHVKLKHIDMTQALKSVE